MTYTSPLRCSTCVYVGVLVCMCSWTKVSNVRTKMPRSGLNSSINFRTVTFKIYATGTYPALSD